MAGIAKDYAGGNGSVRTFGGKKGGLRNKRKAHWAKIHMAERKEKELKAKRKERERERDLFGGDPFAWERDSQ
jgi:hypothetical protein